MTVTDNAAERLRELLEKAGKAAGGLRIEGFIGTCRGSTPILKPVDQPQGGDKVFETGGVRLFIAPDCVDQLAASTIDYDPSLFGKGLNMTWPHRDGCACQSRQ
jgi:iron-sulfur cluster assembly protein